MFNVIGLGDAKPGSHGELIFNATSITLDQEKTLTQIPYESVHSFTLENSTRPMLHGIGGSLASNAPNGFGELYSAIRPSATTLSLIYEDENDAIHAAVLILSKGGRDVVGEAFARLGRKADQQLGLRPGGTRNEARVADAATPATGRSVIVEFPQISGDAMKTMPAAFVATLYEQTIAQLAKSREFETVYRYRDSGADESAGSLTMKVLRVRKGSAGVRGAVPVLGMILGKTLIEANVRYSNAAGAALIERNFKGSQRMPGENDGSSKSLAKRLARAIKKEHQIADRILKDEAAQIGN